MRGKNKGKEDEVEGRKGPLINMNPKHCVSWIKEERRGGGKGSGGRDREERGWEEGK